MTNEEIAADIEQYVKYALGLHMERDAVAVLIAKRMLYYLSQMPSSDEGLRTYEQLTLLGL